MGCRHSSSPPGSPKKAVKNAGPIALKSKRFFHHSQKLHQSKLYGLKTSSSSKLLPALNLEHVLDGHGESLVKRFEFTSTCLLFDVSSTHILVLDDDQLHLIHIGTMHMESCFVSKEKMDIQEIVWSSQVNRFLVLTTDRLYQTDVDQIQLKSIEQIQVRTVSPGWRRARKHSDIPTHIPGIRCGDQISVDTDKATRDV